MSDSILVNQYAPDKGKNKTIKKVYVASMLLLVFVIVFIYCYINLWSTNAQSNKAIDNTTKILSEKGIKWSLLTTEQKANYLQQYGQYNAAESIWQKDLNQSSNNSQKAGVYYQQLVLAIQFKHYNEATTYANQIQSISPNSRVSDVAFSQLYAAQGDKSKAVQYLQKAIRSVNPNEDGSNIKISNYQEQIDEIEAAK